MQHQNKLDFQFDFKYDFCARGIPRQPNQYKYDEDWISYCISRLLQVDVPRQENLLADDNDEDRENVRMRDVSYVACHLLCAFEMCQTHHGPKYPMTIQQN